VWFWWWVRLAAYVATRPAEFRIARSRAVAAPPEVVHAYVNDFRKWPEWSSWEGKDPALKRSYSGAPAGQGAVYAWVGNKEVGEGRMTIVDSRPPTSVTIRLEFLKPFTATATAQFEIVPTGSGTGVTWAMTGRRGFMEKAFSAVMDMDKLIGGEFEKGLAALDNATTTAAKRAAVTASPTS
jgi:hypothetical protein